MSLLADFLFIPGIGFDPFIRGFLVVAVGVLVLMGSVYILLATNSGARTGMMLALAGFFGWMAIMGSIWWIYGIGWAGQSPTWDVFEVNRGDLTRAGFDEGAELGELIEGQGGPASIQALFADGEVAGLSPNVGEWRGMLLSNPARGEAQATVDAFLAEEGEFESVNQYLPIGAFETGGKAKRASSGTVDRVANRLYTTFIQVRHPTRYAVVIVQGVEDRSLITRPGLAPPLRVTDPDKPVISVMLVRDLGNKRLQPALVTIISTLLFAYFAWRLHDRDKAAAANRERLPATVDA